MLAPSFLCAAALFAEPAPSAVPEASAEIEPPALVHWQGDPTCADDDGFGRALDRWRGSDASPSPPGVTIAIELQPGADARWSARISIAAPWGTSERTLEASACDHVIETAALLAAIALDPVAVVPAIAGRVASPASPEPEPEPVPEPVPEPESPRREPPSMAPEPRATPPRRERLRGWVRVDGLAGAGWVPGTSGAVGGAVGVERGLWSLGVAAAWWPPRRSAPLPTGAYAVIDLVTVGPSLCGVVWTGAVTLQLCGSLGASAMRGRGRQVAAPRDRVRAMVDVALGPALQWMPSRHVGVVAAVDGAVLAVRPRFAIAGAGELYRAPQVAVRARVGLIVRWP